MLLNGSETLRKPSIVNDTEFQNLVTWTEAKIEDYLEKGHRSFTVKDLFGISHWDWTFNKYPIQILYYRWREKYERENPNLSQDELTVKAYDAAGISVGHIIKQACFRSQRNFRITKEFRITRYSVV